MVSGAPKLKFSNTKSCCFRPFRYSAATLFAVNVRPVFWSNRIAKKLAVGIEKNPNRTLKMMSHDLQQEKELNIRLDRYLSTFPIWLELFQEHPDQIGLPKENQERSAVIRGDSVKLCGFNLRATLW